MTRTPLARNPRRTRLEHAQETAQDYAEMVAELIETTGEARVIDLARRLGVTHVTVSRTLRRLRREGIVTFLPYRSIFLTAAGRRLAEEARHRHEVVVEFLQSLGVPAAVAHSDAEGIEHHVSRETLEAFEKQLRARDAARGARGARREARGASSEARGAGRGARES
jgi:DtxR family transcriptional regulator, manganese transport regulator